MCKSINAVAADMLVPFCALAAIAFSGNKHIDVVINNNEIVFWPLWNISVVLIAML